MKRILSFIGTGIFLLAIIVGGLYIYNNFIPRSNQMGSVEFNILGGTLSTNATSTGSYGDGTIPVKVLDGDTGRQYAAFTNPSDTTMYLYFSQTELTVASTTASNTATTTITDLSGISIAAGSMYEITNQNLITGYVYASSTAGSVKKQINVSYK